MQLADDNHEPLHPSEAITPADPAAAEARRAEIYDEVVEVEPTDAEWQATVEESVRGFHADESLGRPAVLSTGCGTSLCKLVLRFESPFDRDAFLGSFSTREPFFSGGQMMVRVDGFSDLEVESYFARSGSELPIVPAR